MSEFSDITLCTCVVCWPSSGQHVYLYYSHFSALCSLSTYLSDSPLNHNSPSKPHYTWGGTLSECCCKQFCHVIKAEMCSAEEKLPCLTHKKERSYIAVVNKLDKSFLCERYTWIKCLLFFSFIDCVLLFCLLSMASWLTFPPLLFIPTFLSKNWVSYTYIRQQPRSLELLI